MDKGNIPLQNLIKYFDTYNRSEGKATATLTWYNEAIKVLRKALEIYPQHPLALSEIGVCHQILNDKQLHIAAKM